MKKFTALMLAAACCMSLAACKSNTEPADESESAGSPTENVAANAEYFEWSPIYETQIIGYSEKGMKQETLVIPADCTQVQSLDNNTTVKHIRFENPDTKIFSYAFNSCTSLESVELPDNLEGIENNVFYGCTSLKNISIPSHVTRIGKSSFEKCSSLTSIKLPNVISVDDSAFEDCTSLEEVIVSDGVSIIGESAFMNCSSLRKVVLPESVETIGNYAFAYCGAVEEIHLPRSVESIAGFSIAQDHAFKLYVKEGSYADKCFGDLGGVELCEKLYS